MAHVWRLVRPEYAIDLSGKGNVAGGARWNSPGRGVVYASFNLSLCVLESLVQLSPPLRVTLPEMVAIRIDIPDVSRRTIARTELPSDLSGDQANRRCRDVGDEWLSAQKHLILVAPSVLVPQESNVMINPAHPLMDRVKIASVEPFRFDSRLADR
jgi:RES domain-containing protein